MGVLECSNNECTNIMSDFTIPNIGSVCHECVTKFAIWVEDNNLSFQTESELEIALASFLSVPMSVKPESSKIDLNEYFEKHTRFV